MEFPFEGINPFEPGRWGDIHCYNDINRASVKKFVETHNLDVWKATLFPREYVADVEKLIKQIYGEEVVAKKRELHVQKFRFFEGIASYINYIYSHVNPTLELLKDDTLNLGYKAYKKQQERSNSLKKTFRSPTIVDEKSQSVAKGFSFPMQSVAASAVSTFGDPPYSCTTQEENLFRSMTFMGRLETQFLKSVYCEGIETKTKNGVVSEECFSCFRYREEFAPKGGKCVLIFEKDRIYFLCAAPNNKNKDLSEEDQRQGFRDLFGALYKAAQGYGCDIVGAASGLGVFNCDVKIYVEMLNEVRKEYERDDGSLDHTIAYFRPDKNDEKVALNYNEIATALGCKLVEVPKKK